MDQVGEGARRTEGLALAQRPLLILPTAVPIPVPGGRGFVPPAIQVPGAPRQRRRFEDQYQRLNRALNAPGGLMSLRDDPASIAPDRAIVFEIAGNVSGFYRAVRRIPGLDFFAEEDQAFDPDGDFAVRDAPGDEVPGKFYLAMPTAGALEDILRLYRLYRRNRPLPRGSTPWRDLFRCLKTMRAWGPQDRVSDADIAIWQEELADAGIVELRVEAELFYRANPDQRAAAMQAVEEAAAELGGEVIARADIPAISYQAALIRLPVPAVRQLLDRAPVDLVLADQIMFIKPQASQRAPRGEDLPVRGRPVGRLAGRLAGEPVAALLDGVPLQNHDLLAGRLIVNDADQLEPMAVLAARHHGTAMASLILHGDLSVDGASLDRPLYVHPVMYGTHADRPEEFHGERLLVDTIYRAVVQMKDPEAAGGPTAPGVFLINVSLGDTRRLYAGPVSPLAKLFDHLAHRYDLLFLISAGNIKEDITLDGFNTLAQLEAADGAAISRAFLTSIRESRSRRSLMAPSEGLNPLTVGAAHDDGFAPGRPAAGAVVPYSLGGLPNVSSALGLGHRRVVKPDVLMPGGRERLRLRRTNPLVLRHPDIAQGCGLCAAAPDSAGVGRLSHRTYLCGTSPATALATRAAHQIFDAMMDADGGSNLAEVDAGFYPVIVKALLVHSARWQSDAAALIGEIFGPADRHVERVDNISRLLGYGVPDIQRVLDCSPRQATLVGYGEIDTAHAHEYRIPLPECLQAVIDPRTVVVTVAWMSPVSGAHIDYRRAQLLLDLPEHNAAIGVRRAAGQQPTDHASKRGSVIHEIYEGEDAAVFIEEGHLVLRVWCKQRPNKLPLENTIRYAVAVTMEAGTPLPVYEQTAVRLREAIRP